MMHDDDHSEADETQIYAAVHGATPSGAPPDELGARLRSIRNELCRPPAAQPRWNHLAAMRNANPTHAPRRKVRGAVAIAAATVGLVAVTTGLAAADRLPRSAQDQVAKLAELVGVDLPGNEPPAATSPTDSPTDSSRPVKVREPAGGPRRPDAPAASPDDGDHPTVSGRQSHANPVAPAVAASSAGARPGRTGETPSRTDTSPPAALVPPGQSGSGSGSGQSASAPGQGGSGPGSSEHAPGQTGASPGQSAAAPGQVGGAGQSESTPAATAGAKHSPPEATGKG